MTKDRAITGQPGLARVRALLEACGLPYADLDEPAMAGFLAIEDQSRLVATLGLEIHPGDALLRSLAVAAGYRRQGLAQRLLQAGEARAGTLGVERLWLLTETAQDWFAARGYHVVARVDAPACIRGCAEFTELCPDSAILMCRRLQPD